MNAQRDHLPFRDMVAIAHHEILAAWIVCCDLLDRPRSVNEDHFERLTLAVRRLDALKAAA